jgi:hypothetical protein
MINLEVSSIVPPLKPIDVDHPAAK